LDCAVLCKASREVLPPLLCAHARAYACVHTRPHLRPVGPKLIPLLRIQEPAIVEHQGSRPINSITSSIITNHIDRSTYREPLAFKQNTSNTMGLYFDFHNARDILT
jgi:hypothetical protein